MRPMNDKTTANLTPENRKEKAEPPLYMLLSLLTAGEYRTAQNLLDAQRKCDERCEENRFPEANRFKGHRFWRKRLRRAENALIASATETSVKRWSQYGHITLPSTGTELR